MSADTITEEQFKRLLRENLLLEIVHDYKYVDSHTRTKYIQLRIVGDKLPFERIQLE